ncbi:MAG: M23 family metallopeptidase [Oscillospiraceae bacterium]|nr:M23 family metallopeptidase [Oscillospiraceae bacterium]
MLFDKEKKRPGFPGGSTFYAVVSLAIVAAGVGVWGAVSSSLSRSLPPAATPLSTINWDSYVTRPLPEELPEEPANQRPANVPDTRPEASTAKRENTPYTGSFALPFGSKISKDYSDGEMVKSKTMGDWRVHNGVDFEGAPEEEVLAIQDGTVTRLEQDPLWGIVLVVDHGSGIVARYCGLSENSTPQTGQTVQKGEPVGIIAQVPSESAEGTHLHFEISVNGKAADPLAVMNKSGE